MSEKTTHPQLAGELKQDRVIKKMPVFLNIGGTEKEIWATYEIKPEETIGICSVCNKEKQKIVKNKIKGDPVVDSYDLAIIAEVQEKIKKLIDRVEGKICVCKDCFNDDFISKRPARYIQAMKEASEELGIRIDLEGLRKAVMGVE